MRELKPQFMKPASATTTNTTAISKKKKKTYLKTPSYKRISVVGPDHISPWVCRRRKTNRWQKDFAPQATLTIHPPSDVVIRQNLWIPSPLELITTCSTKTHVAALVRRASSVTANHISRHDEDTSCRKFHLRICNTYNVDVL